MTNNLLTRLSNGTRNCIAIGALGVVLAITSPIHLAQSMYSTERYLPIANQYLEMKNSLSNLEARKIRLENTIVSSNNPETDAKLRHLYQSEYEEIEQIVSVIADRHYEISKVENSEELQEYNRLIRKGNTRALFQAGIGVLLMLGAFLDEVAAKKQKYLAEGK